MRKIQPTLQSDGFNSFKDLLSRPSNIITVGPDKCDFTSPLDASNTAQSGDLIFVYPGTYDIGNNSIQLINGVNWKFISGVTITSDSTDGTFKDGGLTVDVKFDGKPTIINTNGFNKIIVKEFSSNIDFQIRLIFRPVFAPGSADGELEDNPYFTISSSYNSPSDQYEFTFSSQVPTSTLFPASFIVIDDGTWKAVKGHNNSSMLYFTINDISTGAKLPISDIVDYLSVELVFSFRSRNWG